MDEALGSSNTDQQNFGTNPAEAVVAGKEA